ncbi:hypothetical protein Bca52824_002217 [Brassica carinata]|uniref:RNase H type-1 domain-containing protein n=1 Tax=Brassica carinata TaxID=52824 RepID=A0A8X7WKE7_BRACI|nr:hypothetical protein Bca52824_002217 [Brassica carinata]
MLIERRESNARTHELTIQEVLTPSTIYYCLVDASWVNERELGGIGWSLYEKEGIHKLHGSSSIKPTNSALEAEATAMFMAVQQMKEAWFSTEGTIKGVRVTEAFSLLRDIKVMTKEGNFSFI